MLRTLCAGAIAGLLLAAPLHAQSSRPGSFGITPYAGYMRFGNLVKGPLGTSVRGAAGPVYGAEATLGITPGLALVGNVAYASSDLEVGLPVVGGLSFGKSSALLYDAALRLSVPLSAGGGGGIRPFVQAGAGAMRQEIEVDPVATTSTNFAYNLGAGVDVPLGSRLGLQLMAKDYIGKFDASEATALNLNTETTHNWTISAGVRLGL
jgi:Outer membrane protein beta-barrel domain